MTYKELNQNCRQPEVALLETWHGPEITASPCPPRWSLAPFLDTVSSQLRKRERLFKLVGEGDGRVSGCRLARLSCERVAPEGTLSRRFRMREPFRCRNGAGGYVAAATTYKRAPPASEWRQSVRYRSNHIWKGFSGAIFTPEGKFSQRRRTNHALGVNCAELAALSRFLSSSRLSKTFYQLHCSCEW